MNTTQNSELIDEMIAELDKARTTKQSQMANISDISEKTNNILLHIESAHTAKPTGDESTASRYTYNKETLYNLSKTVEIFERLLKRKTEIHQPLGDFETYITSTKSKIDALGSVVRKLLAVNDTVNHIGGELRNEVDDFDLDSDTGDANSTE